ncbi:MAG: O-antigen ligase family protein [Patescibacteria group bacterium]|nr:O-antigen ligase family protein [Patescibacteria group bacterium]
MLYLVFLFIVLFFILAWRRPDLAVMFLIAALPAYLIRFNISGLPATLLEAMIWIVFLVWAIKNFSRVKNNFLENFKKENKKIKISYPFDWEIVLLLLVSLAAAGVAGFSASSLGVWKAYFFEPIMFFIVVVNIMKGEKGREKILWSLAVSALAVSALAIYQKFTGAFIGNPLWAAESTRRVVSFFGYPNAVGLYLGPIVLLLAGWLASVIAYARNGKIKIIFISLTIILSSLSIYFAKSKGALLGVAAGLIIFGLLVNKKIRWATIIFLIIMGLGVAAYRPARDLGVSNFTLTNKSGQIRKAGWSDAWRMLKDGHLITGAGLANFQAEVAPYHTEGIFIKDFSDPDAQRKLVFNEVYRVAHWQPLEIYLYPHNIVLNFWSELGLIGLLLFVWIIGKFFWMGIRLLSLRGSVSDRSNLTNKKFIIIGLICAMAAIVAHGLVDVPYFKNDLAVMFWLLVAMISMVKLESVNN